MGKQAFNWFGGMISVISGAISGAVSGIFGPMIADPTDFNFGSGLHKMMVVAGITTAVSVIVAVGNYLAKSPLPGWSGMVTTTTVEQPAANVTRVTKVEAPIDSEHPTAAAPPQNPPAVS